MFKAKSLLLLVLFSLTLSACIKTPATKPKEDDTKLLYNVLDIAKRPFLVLAPHSSNRLISLYLDRVDKDVVSSTIDIDYLSGSSLKGGRVSPQFPVKLPHTQAFLLGSCSTGGKCSFDTNLTTGSVKTRLNFNNGSAHILKSNFAFVNGKTTTTDARIVYTPKNPSMANQIILDTQGLPLMADIQPSFSPIAISTISSKAVNGTLEIKASGIKEIKYFDGQSYQPQKAKISSDSVIIDLNHTPWHKQATITRDDQKGSSEVVDLYVVGPFVLVK